MPSSSAGTARDGRFATTQWSLVLAAGQRGSAGAEEALASLCSLYWYPIFAFVRRQGYRADQAQDLTQGFFARLIEKGDLGDADPSRGRFRSFLLTACQHFLSNGARRNGGRLSGGISRSTGKSPSKSSRPRPTRASSTMVDSSLLGLLRSLCD